jgi:CRP-like cAMP-binding protein
MSEGSAEPGPGQNRLLQLFGEADLDLVRPHLEQVAMGRGEVCIEPSRPITHVYFIESGLGSSVYPDDVNGTSEIGMQGFEGLIGVPVLLGVDRSPHKVFMQVGSTLQRIASVPLREALARSPSLRGLLLRYVQVFLIQTAQTAHVNARFPIADRLARWILMAADRLGPQLSLTHDYLSHMLGVRRSGVTDALHILEGKALIRSSRGLITVRDRDGLEALAGASYGAPEAEYERLIGAWRKPHSKSAPI